MTVAFEEIEAPRLKVTADGNFHGQRVFLVNFTDAAQAMLELYGGFNVVGNQSFHYPPATFPRFPGAVCIDVVAEGWPADAPQPTTLANFQSDVTTFPKAKITATYGPLPSGTSAHPPGTPSIPDGTFLTVDGLIGSEVLTIPGNHWKWSSGPGAGTSLPNDAPPPGFMVVSQEFSLIWTRVPRPPWTTMRTLQGALSVNNASFLGFPAGYVRYNATEFSRAWSFTQTSMWTLRHKFTARNIPWNQAYYRGDPEDSFNGAGFQTFVNQAGDAMHTPADLTTLFQFE